MGYAKSSGCPILLDSLLGFPSENHLNDALYPKVCMPPALPMYARPVVIEREPTSPPFQPPHAVDILETSVKDTFTENGTETTTLDELCAWPCKAQLASRLDLDSWPALPSKPKTST